MSSRVWLKPVAVGEVSLREDWADRHREPKSGQHAIAASRAFSNRLERSSSGPLRIWFIT